MIVQKVIYLGNNYRDREIRGSFMNVNVVLFATWGDPYNWSEVEYRIPIKDIIESIKGLSKPKDYSDLLNKSRDIEKSTSTTLSLAKKLDELNIEYSLIIFVPNTLALAKALTSSNDNIRWAKKYRKLCLSRLENVLKDNSEAYKEKLLPTLNECSKTYVEKYVEETYPQALDRLKVNVIPGLGKYKISINNTSYSISIKSSLTIQINNLFTTLIKNLYDLGPRIVIADLSHGHNYMPVILYRVLKDALYIYALSREDAEEKINYMFIQSDPYTGATGTYDIHIIERNVIRRDEVYKKIYRTIALSELKSVVKPSKYCSEARVNCVDILKGISEKIRGNKDLYTNLKNMVKASELSLVLPYTYYALTILEQTRDSSPEKIVNNYYSLFNEIISKSISIRRNGNSYSIYYLVKLNEVFYNIIAKNILALYLARIFRGKNIDYIRSNGKSNPIGFRLCLINSIKDNLINKVLSTNEVDNLIERLDYLIANRDNSSMKAIVDELLNGKTILYERVYRVTKTIHRLKHVRCNKISPCIDKVVKSIDVSETTDFTNRECTLNGSDVRNFFAHAGILAKITFIKLQKTNGKDYDIEVYLENKVPLKYKLYIGYIALECMNKINKIMRKSL